MTDRIGLGDRITCGRCTMGFTVKRPNSKSERFRCPDCNKRFTGGLPSTDPHARLPAKCGIEPRCLPDWGYNPDGTPA